MENEFIVCPKCNEQNSATNNYCKKCATPLKGNTPPANQPIPPVSPKKKNTGCLITVGAVILIVIIIIAANSGNKSPSTNVANNTSTSQTNQTTSTQTSSQQKDTTYDINQTAKVKGVEMTITNVKKSNGSEYDKPKSGKEFVIINVKIKNTNADKLSYNPFYFKMQNSKGQLEDETFSTVNTDTALQSGDLLKNGEVEGTIVFEEPTDDTGLILQYQDNIFFDNAKISFKIN